MLFHEGEGSQCCYAWADTQLDFNMHRQCFAARGGPVSPPKEHLHYILLELLSTFSSLDKRKSGAVRVSLHSG